MELETFSANLDQTHTRLVQGLAKNARDYNWRMAQLKSLQKLLVENDQALCAAMWKDLRKSEFECAATEQGVVLAEISFALKHLEKWMKPQAVGTSLYNWPSKGVIIHQAYGLSLIIGAWNYPINLLLAPLVAAITGGNGAILKPSEISSATAALIAELIPRYMDRELFAVVLGGPAESGILLGKKFDFIFFTGSGKVGQIVMNKASEQLTPVVLELGGKSPAVVMADADIAVSARRIVWGKFMNAGQTCVAPDYLIVHSSILDELTTEIKKRLRQFYGEDPRSSPDYCRIVNAKNFDRLITLMTSGEVVFGGSSLREELYIAPTLLRTNAESAVMQEEIFGPLLPILTMDSTDEIIHFINSRPQPLALYLFSKDSAVQARFENETVSGSICHNDVVMHLPEPRLPFGGVGASGMGHYHGQFGFNIFTHAKGILRKGSWFDLPVRYPPYTPRKAWWLKWLFK